MREAEKRFPRGPRFAIVYDTTPFVRESVSEVFHTLRDAVILVAIVVLLFLQDWKSVLLPLVGVGVSLFVLVVLWAVGLIAGFALLHWSLGTALSVAEAGIDAYLYFSGTTFSTLGYGDMVPTGAAGRVLSVAESGVGFVFLAVIVSYLPVLYQAFTSRSSTPLRPTSCSRCRLSSRKSRRWTIGKPAPGRRALLASAACRRQAAGTTTSIELLDFLSCREKDSPSSLAPYGRAEPKENQNED